MPESNTKNHSSIAQTGGAGEDKSVSSVSKPAMILFGLVFLSIGASVLLWIKFRSMDKQIRLLTQQVAQVPSEDDFRMAQESWASQFHQKQLEQTALVMARLESLTRAVEDARAHLHQLQPRQDATDIVGDSEVQPDVGSEPDSQVDVSDQFNIDKEAVSMSLMTDVDQTGRPVVETENEDDDDMPTFVTTATSVASLSTTSAPIAESPVASLSTTAAPMIAKSPVASSSTTPAPMIAKSPLASLSTTPAVVHDVSPAASVSATSDPAPDTPSVATRRVIPNINHSEVVGSPSAFTPKLRLPNTFLQLHSHLTDVQADTERAGEQSDVSESSLDLDADESGIESEASN